SATSFPGRASRSATEFGPEYDHCKPRSDPSHFPQPLKPSVPDPSGPRSSRSHETITAESSVIDNFPAMEMEVWANYSYIACVSENSNDLIRQFVADLESCSIEEQKQAAMEIMLLAKNKPKNRIKIARAGAIKPLISLISSSDHILQENGVTTILNLSLCDEEQRAHSLV
ncbi:hypothetical protein U1Q18_039235, partial [Sarracenia purpurea var. burkii]